MNTFTVSYQHIGHKGTTLLRSEKPDYVPHACAYCGHTLDDGMSVRFETRQVHDIPEPSSLLVVDHRAHVCICSQCNGETKTSFLEGVGSWVPYGPNLTGLVLEPQYPSTPSGEVSGQDRAEDRWPAAMAPCCVSQSSDVSVDWQGPCRP